MFLLRSGSGQDLTRGLSAWTLPNMAEIVVATLALKDAHEVAPLLAASVQDRKRGAPRAPDQYYAELLLKDRTAEIFGARFDGRLVGYAVFFDLPDTMTGMRTGQLDDLFVIQDARGRRIGQALIEALAAEGERRGWRQIRWMVPEKPATARRLAERLAKSGGWLTYSVPVPRP
jgi:GNAT superfamily N-acetyltransferase